MGNILCVISFSSPPLKHRETLRFHLKLFFTHRQTWLTTLQKALKVQTVGGPSVKSAMIALRYAATPQLSSNPCRARLKRVKSYVIGERERERDTSKQIVTCINIIRSAECDMTIAGELSVIWGRFKVNNVTVAYSPSDPKWHQISCKELCQKKINRR